MRGRPSARFHSTAAPRGDPARRGWISLGWHPNRPGWGGRLVMGFDLLVLGLLVLAAWSVYVAYVHFSEDLPSVERLTRAYRPPTISYFYSSRGEVIGEFAREYRIVVPLERVPRHVIRAFLAAEDANFYHHPGVDTTAIVRAFLKNRAAGRIVQGASTITQQVTRTFLLSRERSYRRKIREGLLAYRLEKNLSKDEILFLYLNQTYLGHGAYGVEGAARVYFNKSVEDLGLAEAAMIAGLARAPSRYDPYQSFERAKKRQEYVLRRMAAVGFIRPQQARAAYESALELKSPPDANHIVPQFTEHIRRRVEELVGRERLMADGLRVYTTVDVGMQARARQAVRRGLSELAKRRGYHGPLERGVPPDRWASVTGAGAASGEEDVKKAVITGYSSTRGSLSVSAGGAKGRIPHKNFKWALRGRPASRVFAKGDLVLVSLRGRDNKTGETIFSLEPDIEAQSALVCLENGTGRVRAMVGGRDYGQSQFNRAVQALRQPGSAFKPILYATAMSIGFTPADVLWDEPVEYDDDGRIWRPQNYDRTFHGPTTLYHGLVKSRNVVAVRLMEQVGIDPVIRMARRMGISSKLRPYLSLALGASEVSLLEMVSAYSTFPNLGRRVRPVFISRIEDRDGKAIHTGRVRKDRVLEPGTAYVVLDMMKGVVERGTGTRVAALKRPVAGKTGTSSDLADAWFIGCTPEYTTGVWVGHDLRKRLGRRETGGRAAAPIFLYYVRDILKDRPKAEFEVPEGVTYALIDPDTGWFADEDTLQPLKVCFNSEHVGQGARSEMIDDPDRAFPEDAGRREHIRIIFRNGRYYSVREPDEPGPDPGAPALESGAPLVIYE